MVHDLVYVISVESKINLNHRVEYNLSNKTLKVIMSKIITRERSPYVMLMLLLWQRTMMFLLLGTLSTTRSIFVLSWMPLSAQNSLPVTKSYSRISFLSNNKSQMRTTPTTTSLLSSSSSSSSSSSISVNDTTKQELEMKITQLKRILEREYITFFNPMERDYYNECVTFIDPLTTLNGIDLYENNVNMLSGRTMFGSILFSDARIILHTITGGNVICKSDNDDTTNIEKYHIENIITRWTLRFTFKILPWQPSPCFTGISNYTITTGGTMGVQIIQQNDYWDSINLQPGGIYNSVSNSIAIQHFISLILPNNKLKAISAGPELPYTILRLGPDYEVRRYPSYLAVQMIYERRDEAFIAMGSYTSGMNPLAPAIIQVNTTDPNNTIKTMYWPIRYALPGETLTTTDLPAVKKDDIDYIDNENGITTIVIPESVVAVRTFTDMILEPLVRKIDISLRNSLIRDGLLLSSSLQSNNNPIITNNILTFAQYDAIYSMGERRNEVHIKLENGTHPW